MNFKRYLVEFDSGADIHGMNVTKAAQRACKNAISNCCLCGISDIFNMDKVTESVRLEIKIASPFPDKVDVEEVKKVLPPYEEIKIDVTEGGMTVKGLHVENLGDGDTIVVVNAAITVYVDVDKLAI